MHVDVIESFDSFAALESNWKALYRVDPDAQLFLSWSWLSWVFREHPGEWRVLAVKLDRDAAEYVRFSSYQAQDYLEQEQAKVQKRSSHGWPSCLGAVHRFLVRSGS